jgi:pyridinium-3,5-bisthiocarboxylic acid mononucleotide nickel chelatase
MKCLYLDCFAGISGDMTVGALLDLGVEQTALERELTKLHLTGYKLEVTRVDKRGLQATQFKVILTDDAHEHVADSEVVEAPPGAHEHAHTHEHDHDHAPALQHTHRALSEILSIIHASDLSAWVKERASAIFTRLGQAEATVHGVDIEQVHFHEVGGVDAIVDIVGAVIGLEILEVDRVMASPLHLGSGFVHISHGTYPIPAPATALLVRGVPVYATEAKGELVTPTGAAIVTTLAQSFGPMPKMAIEKVGYGAGTRDRDFPNVVRVFLGVLASDSQATVSGERAPRAPHPEQHAVAVNAQGYQEQTAVVIEASIDDMNPQHFEALIEALLQAGALDALMLPAQMKKQRPGTLLQVTSHTNGVNDLLAIIFRESTTIGVRTYAVQRHMLPRELHEVATRYGVVRVKVARHGDKVLNIAPEYEDCRALARQHDVALKMVYAAALGAASEAFL